MIGPSLRYFMAKSHLSQAMAVARTKYTPEAFEAALEALHASPEDGEAWQAACAEWALYGQLLREKALAKDEDY